ncbi:MaoC family dehydratase [Clostridium oryzae]|uniref:(R)-specific enoyl-CoA hydratase n=1 Tax=Clostridium oryzae TaxID=1450648 RepID=A0A1V4IES9_9CLOT|nr:MaoC family dehydratase [Clostridium oryzae]OPJ58354.1 (R)-specific enoyl-CoA hydratase [Clostridium oryzae]
MNIDDINLDSKESFTKTISETDVYLFAGITGDFNQLHINESYASKTKFKKRIVHGMLTASLISTILGNKLPGIGTILLEQNCKFIKPVYIGDTITAYVKTKNIIKNSGIVQFYTFCKNQNDEIVLQGEVKVLVKN